MSTETHNVTNTTALCRRLAGYLLLATERKRGISSVSSITQVPSVIRDFKYRPLARRSLTALMEMPNTTVVHLFFSSVILSQLNK